ncbi:MAG: hypothetical protein ACE5NP_00635 [Anaerolineae bacterium]
MPKLFALLLVVWLSTAAVACGIGPPPGPQPTDTPIPTETLPPPMFPPTTTFPLWAQRARIAGAFFEPTESQADIDARLDRLAGQGVSVIIADCPLGWSYSAWVDDGEFRENLTLVAEVVTRAHEQGLKVVWYLTGLELISLGERDPAAEHPDWVQVSIEGEPLVFSDIGSEQEHWLEEGNIDVWVSPSSPYRDFYVGRVADLVASGVDGLWVDTAYLQGAIGQHEELWPSHDPFSAAAFREATGFDLPIREDWEDPTWRRWVVWRHQDILNFLVAVKEAAQAVNPDILFFEENWNVDSSGATHYANDPTLYAALPDLATGHEVSTIGDRTDLGETGMQEATLDQWLDFVTMIKFARGADRGKPSWILTYGYRPEDAERLAGVILANGANYYETRGPGMADSVGDTYRQRIFAWIRGQEEAIYGTSSMAQVGLLYSARTRDLFDQGGGDLYDTSETAFLAEYRAGAKALLRAHIPFDIVVDNDLTLEQVQRYRWLILPNAACMDGEEADLLRQYEQQGGRLIVVGESGHYDEWCQERDRSAVDDIPSLYIESLANQAGASQLIESLNSENADLALIETNAPPGVELELRQGSDFLALFLVNLGREVISDLEITFELPAGRSIRQVRWESPDGDSGPLEYALQDSSITLTVSRLSILGLVLVEWLY